MKTEKKKQEDLTNVVNALVEAYGEDRAFAKMFDLLPRPEPRFICSVSIGSPKSKNCLRKFIQGASLTDKGFLIHLGDEPIRTSDIYADVVGDLINCKDTVFPFDFVKWHTCASCCLPEGYETIDELNEEESSNG